jgi:hypothetical protein
LKSDIILSGHDKPAISRFLFYFLLLSWIDIRVIKCEKLRCKQAIFNCQNRFLLVSITDLFGCKIYLWAIEINWPWKTLDTFLMRKISSIKKDKNRPPKKTSFKEPASENANHKKSDKARINSRTRAVLNPAIVFLC